MRLIVVGSGIVGSACAWTAARLGAEVVLVDAELAGRATAAGAGIICPWSSRVDEPVWYALACTAAREYPALVASLAEAGAGEVSYRQVGALYLAADVEQASRDRDALQARRSAAPEIGEVAVLSPAEAQALFPPLRTDVAAVHISGAARVDGRLMAAALASAARRSGAVVVAGAARLAVKAGRVAGVHVDGQFVAGDAVVAATGAWTAEFVAPAGALVRVSPQRGQIAHISVAPARTAGWPVILPAASGHYLLAFDDSRVVVGATRETGSGFDYRVTPGGLAEVLGEALSVAPGLRSGTYLETRVGFRPAGPDHLPLLGPVGGVDGLVVATGLGASGLTLGPLAGAVAARAALGVEQEHDLTPFDPLR
jgi:D-amino-acid dehydrogenase